jgi:hypothetical protein
MCRGVVVLPLNSRGGGRDTGDPDHGGLWIASDVELAREEVRQVCGNGDNRQDGADRGKETSGARGRGSRPYLDAEAPCAISHLKPTCPGTHLRFAINSRDGPPPRWLACRRVGSGDRCAVAREHTTFRVLTLRHQIASGHTASRTGRRSRRVAYQPRLSGRIRHVLSSLSGRFVAGGRPAATKSSRSPHRGCCGAPGFVSRFTLWQPRERRS